MERGELCVSELNQDLHSREFSKSGLQPKETEEGSPRKASTSQETENGAVSSLAEAFAAALEPGIANTDASYIATRRFLLHRKSLSGITQRQTWQCNGLDYVLYRHFIRSFQNVDSQRFTSPGDSGRWASPSTPSLSYGRDSGSSSKFVRQFQIMYGRDNYKEKEKIKFAALPLTDLACTWWTGLEYDYRTPKSWRSFVRMLQAQFLPVHFKRDVKMEWDRLWQRKNESLEEYIKRFWELLLKVQHFKRIGNSEKLRKFQKEHNSGDSLLKREKKRPASSEANSAHKEGQSQHQRSTSNSKKMKPYSSFGVPQFCSTLYPQRKQFTEEEKQQCMKEEKCFKCGQTGHIAKQCSNKGQNKTSEEKSKPPVRVNAIRDVMGNTHHTPEMRQLLKAWGQFQGKQGLFLIDLTANENLISWNLAKDLGLKNEDMETPLETRQALNAHDGDTMKTVLLYIGKLKFELQGFKNEDSFCIADLDGEDVILGMPWNHKVDSTIYSMKKKVEFTRKGKKHEIQAGVSGDTIPMLPPERPEDHYIDIIPGSFPPNIALYRKKDGTFRMCMDYRALNKITVKNRFPIPRIDDILDRLEDSKIFSRIDLKSGYHQIRVIPQDTHKTAFRTSFGLHESLVILVGLTNAPATFNRMMERIFRDHRQYVGTFFDDILVFSKNEEEHRQHLEIVLQLLCQNQLLVNGKKSEFFMHEINYLGHVISSKDIQMDFEKIKII
ncbi:hypothetical protein L7F22_055354 [Adiantum nelumboides]|nr:hypothetical protein [Adiantum nelumboides]